MLLKARSSNAKVNKAIRITRETSIISQKIEGFGGRPPVGGRPGAGPPGPSPKSGTVVITAHMERLTSCRSAYVTLGYHSLEPTNIILKTYLFSVAF